MEMQRDEKSFAHSIEHLENIFSNRFYSHLPKLLKRYTLWCLGTYLTVFFDTTSDDWVPKQEKQKVKITEY